MAATATSRTAAENLAIELFKTYEDLRLASWADAATVAEVDAADQARLLAWAALDDNHSAYVVSDATHAYRHSVYGPGVARAIAAWQQRGAKLDRLGATAAAAVCRQRVASFAALQRNGGSDR